MTSPTEVIEAERRRVNGEAHAEPPGDDLDGWTPCDESAPEWDRGLEDENVVPIGSARTRKTKSSKSQRIPSRPFEPWEEELAEKLILTGQKQGQAATIRPTSANVATILAHHPLWRGVVALNLFHLRIETTRVPPWHDLDMPAEPKAGPWKEGDTARLAHWLARTSICDMPPICVSPKLVETAVLVAAESNGFHPVKDYWRALTWDGTPRVDSLAMSYLGGEATAYARSVSAVLLIGAVARVMQPGCKLDTMVVLEGEQGKKKSTLIEVLASPWFADSRLPLGEKDSMQMLPGILIYEIAELAGLSKADVETTKAFLSSRRDRFRPSYGKYVVDVPRQTSFVASTNIDSYLQDHTGGRRFLPLRTGNIDIDAVRRDKDQLWAEAVHRYNAGERWWLDDALARAEQAARFMTDEWQSRIAIYLRGEKTVTIGAILGDLIFADVDKAGAARNNLGRWGQREQNRVARCLIQLGWVRRQVRVSKETKAREWRYVSPDYEPVTTADEEVGT